jgi:beta-glucanase (GH16 family)
MKRRAALGWLAGVAAGAAAQVPLPPAIAGRGLRLVKDWDFGATVTDVAALQREFFTRYIYDGGRLDHLNDEWQRYRDDDHHRFADGTLQLVARPLGQALMPGRIGSGMLRSRWSGQYGYFECCMQVPAGRGLWPAFWLNPQDGRWPPEIDVVEIVDDGRGQGTRRSFHFLHGPGKGPVRFSRLDRDQAWRPGFDFSSGFHRFAVHWTADGVRHYVDDELVADRGFDWRHPDGSDAGPAHVIVNLAVGGRWPGAPDATTPFPAVLKLAHIRVWEA